MTFLNSLLAGIILILAFLCLRFIRRGKSQRVLLDQAHQEIKHLNNEAETLLYSVAHDLRAPLRSVVGFTNIFLEDHGANLNKDAAALAKRITAAAQKMDRLIEGLLYLSRLGRQKIMKEALNLSAFVQNVTTQLKTEQPERKVDIEIEKDVMVQGDAQLLKIAVKNLVDNAWKFTRDQGAAKIEFGLTDHEGQRVCYVRDNGAGFDMKYADKLFGPFQRLHSADEFDGIGVGLAAAQRIIHKHSGRIWAEAKPNEGATFYFVV